jgi:hypothetical protein
MPPTAFLSRAAQEYRLEVLILSCQPSCYEAATGPRGNAAWTSRPMPPAPHVPGRAIALKTRSATAHQLVTTCSETA